MMHQPSSIRTSYICKSDEAIGFKTFLFTSRMKPLVSEHPLFAYRMNLLFSEPCI
jgi:hypothetical protein